jgi:Tfp pilus assembly protein PilO
MRRLWKSQLFRIKSTGWQGSLGLLLLLASLLAVPVQILPQLYRQQSLDQRLQVTKQRMRNGYEPSHKSSPQAVVDGFYRTLPPETSVTETLSSLFQAATENGVDMGSATYTLSRETDARFSRYQVVLPAYGKYSDIRRCVNQILNLLPSVSLDEMSFTRNSAQAAEVEGKLIFSLYLRNNP